ncbi:histone acetyltransferase KAT6A-like [Diadema antillarum]|uniref:histone acetyltransferase KAT6A-like n=1 Tax=Diadema antillarum TaxID=105358 RepID=UPI003A865450
MAAVDLQAVILDAIDSLRKRKARPDLERICHMVERKNGIRSMDVIRELNQMVDAETVIKVDYKGNTSYRNAAKWCRSRLSGSQLNSSDATRAILAAIEKLTAKDESTRSGQAQSLPQPRKADRAPEEGGATLEEIEKFFVDEDPDTKFTHSYLQEAIKREVGVGSLLMSQNGNYLLAKLSSRDKIENHVPKSKRGRPPLKRKRLKKTHGPDFEQEPLVKTPPSDLNCDYCSLPSSCNKSGKREELLVCKDCGLKVHPSCMKYSKELAERSRLSPWQCIDCKTCHVCKEAGDADTLLFCDSCDKGYHMACHTPTVEEKPHGTWVCEPCASEDMEVKSTSTDGDGSLVSSASSTDGSPSYKPTKEHGEDALLQNKPNSTSGQVSPDVATPNLSMPANLPEQSAQSRTSSPTKDSLSTHPSTWSLEDVVSYFKQRGYVEQAASFKDQEIDGNALLLLRRSDVLTGLSFKLGPALKIYKQVSELQLHYAKKSAFDTPTTPSPSLNSVETTSSKKRRTDFSNSVTMAPGHTELLAN